MDFGILEKNDQTVMISSVFVLRLCLIDVPGLNCLNFSSKGAESQKPRQRVSNADRKVFANPECFATSSLLAEEFPDTLQYKISR